MLRYKPILKRGVVIIIFLLSINSILEIDAYLLDRNITTIQAWIITGISLIIVILTFLFNPNYWCSFTKINKNTIIIGFCILIYYFCQIPGLVISSGIYLSSESSFYFIYSIILFIYGGLIGLYLNNNLRHLSTLTLLILVSLLVIDLTLFSFSYNTTGRAEATLRNPNVAAFVVVALMVASLRHPVWKLNTQNILLIIISGIGIALTASMGGGAAYISVLMVLILLSFIRKQINLKEITIFLPVVIVISAVSSYFVLNNKLGLRFNNFDINVILSSPNIFSRLDAARMALKLFSERPIFGHGMAFVYSMDLGPHNLLLRILVEGGLLGFAGLCVLLGGLFWIAYKRKSYRSLLMIIALISIGMTTHNMPEMRSVIFLSGMVFSAHESSSIKPIENI